MLAGMSGTARESIWTRPDRRSRGPVPQHSRAEIVAAATALADAGGLPAVSMRAVAAALDTGAGSLYRYLSSRDDLLDLMVDAALSELPVDRPPSGDWLDRLVGLARDQLALYRRHPWLSEATRRPGAFGPRTVDYFERCLAIMAPLPNAPGAKMEAVAVLTGVVALFSVPAPMNPPPDDPQAMARKQAGQLFALVDPARHPHLAAAFTTPQDNADAGPDLFERTIRGVLRGLLIKPA
ncbi:TetR/AcrR family transcriptional regulator C-terminal domain-containing protein [Dactylosporangium siamense]|uniref:TetR family transcriptional regulator n=2 Tax=Dactylosporangium siamense TaxID=685454 RepID=A0A919PM95_9ACTN|nr:TetR family transcriptional regulator [Dactylosporangium siamense]